MHAENLNILYYIFTGQIVASTVTTTADRSRSASNGSSNGGHRASSAKTPANSGPSPTAVEVCFHCHHMTYTQLPPPLREGHNVFLPAWL